MGATRVTQGLIVQRTLDNLNRQLRRLSDTQEQMATGLRVNRPSDDPVDARRAISLRNEMAKNEQFLTNIEDSRSFMTESEGMLQRVVDILMRVQELTIQGGNDTNAQSQLDMIAIEVNQLLEATVVAANQKSDARSLFAGTRTLTDAYSITRVGGDITAVTYQGNAQSINVSASPGAPIAINVTGTDAFQSSVDIFNMLIGIRDDLRAGNQASLRTTRLTELQGAQSQLLLAEARFGAVSNRLDRIEGTAQDLILELEEVLSDKIDADFAEVMTRFNVGSNALQAALNAAARVIQPSLLDFVR